ncbi:MAG: DUF4097 family beta strand repeat-containing protein [Gemmatimonas sp.]
MFAIDSFSRFRKAIMRLGFRSSFVWVLLAVVAAQQSAGAQGRNDDRNPRPSRNSRPLRADDAEMRLDTTVAVDKGTIVDLSATDGRIIVRGWDRNEVEIHAVSASGELQFSRTARSLRLEARRSGRSNTLDATMTIRVPLNTRVVVGTMLGNVEVLDVHGEVDATLQSGDVIIRGASGRTAVSNVSGSINVSDVDGALRVNAITGKIKLSDVRGDIEVVSSSGDVELRDLPGNSVQIQVIQGDITYEGALSRSGKYEFNTHSGAVHLFLPDSTKGTINMQSFSGLLHSSFPVTLLPGAGTARALTGSVRQLNGRALSLNQQQRVEIGGGNGAQVTISTFNGDVHINRGPRRQ